MFSTALLGFYVYCCSHFLLLCRLGLGVLVFDAVRRTIDGDTRLILDGLKAQGRHAVLALNKIDAIKRERLLDLATRFEAEGLWGA